MADNFIEYGMEWLQNLYDQFLNFFNFEILGKNIRFELGNIIPMVVFFGILLISFKVFFSRSTTIIGKAVVLVLFLLIYLCFQIWIF